jgi:hypothetical protein
MIHERQRLALGLESRHDLPRVHARLDDFQRDAPPHGLQLFGHEDRAEPALADLPNQTVRPNLAAQRFRTGAGGSRAYFSAIRGVRHGRTESYVNETATEADARVTEADVIDLRRRAVSLARDPVFTGGQLVAGELRGIRDLHRCFVSAVAATAFLDHARRVRCCVGLLAERRANCAERMLA